MERSDQLCLADDGAELLRDRHLHPPLLAVTEQIGAILDEDKSDPLQLKQFNQIFDIRLSTRACKVAH